MQSNYMCNYNIVDYTSGSQTVGRDPKGGRGSITGGSRSACEKNKKLLGTKCFSRNFTYYMITQSSLSNIKESCMCKSPLLM